MPEQPLQSQPEVFNLGELQARFLVVQEYGTLTAVQEVELAHLIGTGKASAAALAAAAESGKVIDASAQAELEAQTHAGATAFEIFQQANQGMVKKIAHAVHIKYFYMYRVEYEDLEQQGNIELINAINGFDPDMGNKFSSYGYPTIHRGLENWVKDFGRLMRLSRSMRGKVSEWHHHIESGSTPEEAAAEVGGYTVKGLAEAEAALQRPDAVSYDRVVATLEGDGSSFLEQLAGEDDEMPFAEQVADKLSAQTAVDALHEWLVTRASGLANKSGISAEREFSILLEHYVYGKTLAELGAKWHVSRSRAGQILARTQKLINNSLPEHVTREIEAAGYSPKVNTSKPKT